MEKSKKPPVKKPVAKAPVKASASVSKKAAQKTTVKTASVNVKVAPKPAVKAAVKTEAPAKSAKSAAPAPTKNQPVATPSASPAVIGKTAKAPKAAKVAKVVKAPKGAKVAEVPAVDPAIKRPAKLFFIEVKPGAERVIKRGDKSLAAPAPVDVQAKRKDAATEETSEELMERIDRELQHQSFFKRNTLKPQMCTKCGINVVVERFTIDRELGYCLSCAEILRLGATKEARRMEFNPSLKKEGDPVAAAEGGEVVAPAGEAGEIAEPDAAEVEEEAVPDID